MNRAEKNNPSDNTSPERRDLLDYFLIFLSNIKLILIIIGAFLLIGVLLRFIAPLVTTPQYTASAIVINELPEKAQISGPLVNVGGGRIDMETEGLPQVSSMNLSEQRQTRIISSLPSETIPEIIRSRGLKLAVAQKKYYFEDIDSTLSYIEYLKYRSRQTSLMGTIKKYTINLPGTILSLFKKERVILTDKVSGEVRTLTASETAAIRLLSSALEVTTNQESSVMTISITSSGPVLSARICNEFIEELQKSFQKIYTRKARDNLNFISNKFENVKKELSRAEDKLASFMDSNKNAMEAKLKVEIERLRRIVAFKTSLYQNLQSQKTQAEINLQSKEPVITVIEEPVPPRAPQSRFSLKNFILYGIILSILFIFIRDYIVRMRADKERAAKLDKIAEHFKKIIPKKYRQS